MAKKLTKFDPKRLPDLASLFRESLPVACYQNGWYQYNGTHYEEVSPEYIAKRIIDRFASEKIGSYDATKKKVVYRNYNPTMNWAKNLREYMTGDQCEAPPSWLSESLFPPHETLPVKNGLLHIPTRTLHERTKDFFTLSTSDASYCEYGSPLQHAPAFASMLNRIWGDDRGTQNLLQDVCGYLLTPDPPEQEFQKFFLFRGAARGGKGTTVKIIEALVGSGTCAQIAPENIVRSTFALMPLIDRRIGLLGDLRLADDREVAKKLLPIILKIVGGDPVQIDRKYKGPYHKRLNSKLILESNTDLGVHDATGALASRIVPIVFPASFVGRENPDAPRQILSEIDAILSWALDGWDRVQARRKRKEPLFDLPPTSERELDEIRRQGSAVVTFLNTYCKQALGERTEADIVWGLWKRFAASEGILPKDKRWLTVEIRAAWPRVSTQTAALFGESKRKTYYVGLELSG